MVKTKAKNHQIFLAILKIGVIGFGGGPATIPLFHKEVVDKYKWFKDEEFSDMLAIANTLPGPTQTKLAGYIGYRLRGIIGMLLGLIGIIVPSLLIMLVALNQIYKYKDNAWVAGLSSGVLPVVCVMMATLTWKFLKKSHQSLGKINHGIFLIISIITLVIFDIHPAYLILLLIFSAFLNKITDKTRLIIIASISVLIILFFQFNLDDTIARLFDNINLFPEIKSGFKYIQIFFAFFIPGIIGYGGGPASIPLVQYEVVEHFHLINLEQFAEAIAVQATLPGVTATKLAGSIGYHAGNVLGAVIGVFAYVAPSLILMIVLLGLLNKYKASPIVKRLTSYVGPVITVLLGLLTYRFLYDSIFMISSIYLSILHTVILILISLLLLNKYKIHPFFVILLAMVYGGFLIR